MWKKCFKLVFNFKYPEFKYILIWLDLRIDLNLIILASEQETRDETREGNCTVYRGSDAG